MFILLYTTFTAMRKHRTWELLSERARVSDDGIDFENPRHLRDAERRVEDSLLKEKIRMLTSTVSREKEFMERDWRYDFQQFQNLEREGRQRVKKLTSLNDLYVECVRSSVGIFIEESEARDSLLTTHSTGCSEIIKNLASRDHQEHNIAQDIIRRACHAARNDWCNRQLDEALFLIRQHKERMSATANNGFHERRNPEKVLKMAMRALEVQVPARNGDRGPANPLGTERCVSPQRSRPVAMEGDIISAVKNNLTSPAVEDYALQALQRHKSLTASVGMLDVNKSSILPSLTSGGYSFMDDVSKENIRPTSNPPSVTHSSHGKDLSIPNLLISPDVSFQY